MTSISLNASSTAWAARTVHQQNSPRDDIDSKITAAVKAGALTQTDATALESALNKIDSSLSSSASSSDTSANIDPSQMKAKVDSLVDQQVSDGTLTAEQADELKAIFASGPSGPGGAGGPPPPPPPSDSEALASLESISSTITDTSSSSTSSSSDSSSVTDSSSADAKLEALKAFLDNLRASQAERLSTYSVGGTTSTDSTSGLVLNTTA